MRDAMLRDPKTLAGGASAQEAGRMLARPEVRAVLVCDEGRLLGLVTAAELVMHVVAV
ncbi:MAG: CBS domain-containing protein, partial [Actinobacteria bacterium]|nr:CBS domain-containing protein [Actinomycetota bacterium]